MRKTAALFFSSAIAFSVLAILPGASAAPGVSGCVTVRSSTGVVTTQSTCPYTAPAGGTQTGYVVAVTPNSTWEIYTQYVNSSGQLVHFTIANQDTYGTGSTPCLDSLVGGKHWLCAKSIHPQAGYPYYAVITSGSGVIEIGPQASL